MITYCFVIQHSRAGKSDVDTPSGTLTVVHELIRHWNKEHKIILLCNQDYGNLRFLQEMRDTYGVQLDTSEILTLEDKLARIEYESVNLKFVLLRKSIARVLAPFTTLRVLFYLRRYFLNSRVDVIYSHSGGYPWSNLNLLSVLAGRMAGIRNTFLISHNIPNPISRKRWPFSFVQDRVVGMAAAKILSVSEAAAKLIEDGRLLNRSIGWIHNGISLSHWPGESVPVPAWSKDTQKVIMFLGAIEPRKGLDVLLNALVRVDSGWRLVIYGSGAPEYVQSLEALANHLGILDKILFAGFDPSAAQMLEHCELLVLPSVSYESFGMVILEAMYHKKPVICTDFGGMKEIVVNGRTGFVVPAGDSTELGHAIQQLLDDPRLARDFGIEGHRRLLEVFDIKSAVKKYVELVE